MSVDVAVPRSRRAILAGALGALGGAVAGALGRPQAAQASNGDAIQIGVQASGTLNGTGPNQATAATAIYTTTGVGFSARTDGITNAIVGNAANTGAGSGYGVHGLSALSGGRGVNGIATHATGSTIGVAGESGSTSGIGVRGLASAGSGQTYGVQGIAAGTSGTGVEGRANAFTGATVGVYGQSASSTGRGVVGYTNNGNGNATGVYGESFGVDGTGVEGWSSHPNGFTAGVDGGAASVNGVGVRGSSSFGSVGVFGFSRSTGGPLPELPSEPTGVFALATQSDGRGLQAEALSETGAAIGARGIGWSPDGAGVVGQSWQNGTGVVGMSQPSPSSPVMPGKVGVYGQANQDTGSFGVFGKTTVGQGVRGEATSGTGVRAVSATGKALDVTGRVIMNRSGIVSIPANATSVDVTVPGGIAATAMVFATLQIARSGVWVRAARPAWPSAGKLRIYLNKAASTTESTPVAWMVLR